MSLIHSALLVYEVNHESQNIVSKRLAVYETRETFIDQYLFIISRLRRSMENQSSLFPGSYWEYPTL